MNDDDIATLLREVAEPIGPPDFVEVVQRRAARVRRRRVVAVAVASVGAVTAAGVVAALNSTEDRSEPPVTTPTTNPSPTLTTAPTQTASTAPASQTARPLRPGIAQQPLTADLIAGLPWVDLGIPQALSGSPGGLRALSADPVHRAVAAIEADGDGTGILVLGDDGAWRVVDQPFVGRSDAGGYSSPTLYNQALSPDGRYLAVPQPHKVIVVDATTGAARTYDVPGFNKSATWSPDDRWLLVKTEERPGSSLLDLQDGTVRAVPYGWSAAFTTDGKVVEVADTAPVTSEMRTYERGSDQWTAVQGVANLSGNAQVAAGVLNGTAIAGITDHGWYSGDRGPHEWGGVLVIDETTGDPLALLPMHSYGYQYEAVALGWLDTATVLVFVPATSPTAEGHVLAWNYQTGDIRRVADVPAQLVVAVAQNELG